MNVEPWPYKPIKWLFSVCLNSFYNIVEVHNAEAAKDDGIPAILCPNHSNSLADAAVLMTQTPRFLRQTGKNTLWQLAFFKYFIKGTGAIPIMRKKDHKGAVVNNDVSFQKLYEALESGSMVCLFPEGISRYHPDIAPLKPGVANILLQILERNKQNPDFKIKLVTCGITYIHREKFRSPVLVEYGPPRVFSVSELSELLKKDSNGQPVGLSMITEYIGENLERTVMSAPEWRHLQLANTARSLYAPLGTRISLRTHVQLTKAFIDLFAEEPTDEREASFVTKLQQELQVYQQSLNKLKLKNYRVAQQKDLSLFEKLRRLFVRLLMCCGWVLLAFPGWVCWSPIFLAAKIKEKQLLRKGVEDNMDEVASYKMATAFLLGIPVLLVLYLITLPFILITFWAIPLYLWLTIRFTEDFISSARASMSLFHMIINGRKVKELAMVRSALAAKVTDWGLRRGLPHPSDLAQNRKRGHFFSFRRRRSKDWNETLRLYDVTTF